MLPLERTSLEPMAEALVGGNGQARQQCSSSGVWDDDAVLAKQQELVAATLGDSGARSVSRFNRRLHRLAAWLGLAAETLGELLATVEAFLIDSMPIPACRRARARRCRKVSGKAYCGYCAAKKEKFFDWRLHLVCTTGGVPVAFDLLPGGRHDLTPLHELTDWGCPDATDI